MSTKENKDELEDVETIPREQAEKEMQEAARNVQEKGSRHPSQAGEGEEEVTPATQKQAKEELKEAVERVKEENSKEGKK